MCYYTKSEYSATDGGEGVIGDVINPYSVIAYLFYDTDKDEWVHTYSDEDKAEIINTGMAYTNNGELVTEENFATYEAEWYGQSFVDLGIYLTINDTELYDDYGYWSETPDITVEETVVDPLVVDSDAISYNNLSIYAYTVDLDGSQETIYDREVYVQVYDFDDNSFTYPIQITSNDVSDSMVRLCRFGSSTYLVWLSDGDIKAVDFSNIYRNCLEEYTYSGDTYYYVNKLSGSGYEPEMVLADADEELEDSGDEGKSAIEIGEFGIATDDEDIFLVWTQSGLTYADGVEQNSDEATDPANQYLEYQIYASRYSTVTVNGEETSKWSAPMKLTQGQGAVYSELLPYIGTSGTLTVIAEKGSSAVDANYGVTEDVSSRSMVRLDFSEFERVELGDITVDEFMGNGTSNVSVDISNTGMEDFDDLNVSFYSDGEFFENVEVREIYSGETYDAASIISGNVIKAELYSGTELLAETETEITYAPEITISGAEVDVNTRYYADFTATVTNSGNAYAENLTIVSISDITEEEICETVIESLAPGESVTVDFEGEITDDVYAEITPLDENYSYQEEAAFTLTAEDYDTASVSATRYVTTAESGLLSSVDPVLNDGADSIEVVLGDYNLAYDSVTDENSALQVMWVSSDDSVASVTTGGLISGISLGTATLTAIIAPADRAISFNEDGSYDTESIYFEIPEEGVTVKTITVNVVDQASSDEETETTTADETDAATETTTAKKSSGGGGGGGSGSSSAAATTTTEASAEETTAAADTSSQTGSADTADSSSSDGTAADDFTVFDDVKGTWAEEAVTALAKLGIVSGTGDNLFEPDRNITRAEYVTMLMRMLDDYIEADTSETEQFADISGSSYYSGYVLKAKAAGIAAGYENNEFKPDNNVSRQEMFSFTYRALLSLGLIEASDAELEYTDAASVHSYAVEAIASLTAEGIVSGDGGYVKPLDYARRNEAAQMMYNITQSLLQLEDEQ